MGRIAYFRASVFVSEVDDVADVGREDAPGLLNHWMLLSELRGRAAGGLSWLFCSTSRSGCAGQQFEDQSSGVRVAESSLEEAIRIRVENDGEHGL
jgi:hypothetical protein